VALGDNIRLGGKNKAPTHIDLVFKNPHIQLGAIAVLKGNELRL
jgi:hypothetical protein